MAEAARDTSQVGANEFVMRLDEIKARHTAQGARWSEYLVATPDLRINMICAAPGAVSKRHHHPQSDEAWVIVEGEVEFRVDGRQPVRAGPGDYVFVPRGVYHELEVVGDRPSIRLAIVAPNDRPWTIPPEG